MYIHVSDDSILFRAWGCRSVFNEICRHSFFLSRILGFAFAIDFRFCLTFLEGAANSADGFRAALSFGMIILAAANAMVNELSWSSRSEIRHKFTSSPSRTRAWLTLKTNLVLYTLLGHHRGGARCVGVVDDDHRLILFSFLFPYFFGIVCEI